MSTRSRRKPLPDGVELLEDGTLLCQICDSTFLYESLRNHLRSQGHQAIIATNAAAQQYAQQEEDNYGSLYDNSLDQPLNNPSAVPALDDVGSSDSTSTERPAAIDPEDLHAYAGDYLRSHAAPDGQEYRQRQMDGMDRLLLDLSLLFMHDDLTAGAEDATLPESAAPEPQVGEDDEPALTEDEIRSALTAAWSPYPNKTMFFLDLLDSLPRLRLSDSQLRMILWIMEQCGARNVPSFYKLRKWQKQLRRLCSVPTLSHRSSMGNIFYSNHICGTIAMDFAKPAVASQMCHYPEISSKGVSEARHAGRWGETDLAHLTPMFANGAEHFYVNELCRLSNGQFFVPKVWHLRDGVLHASGFPCTINTDATLHVGTEAFVLAPASNFVKSMPTLVAENAMPGFDEASEAERRNMPNPLRELADGAELYSVFVNIFGDDVSGNVSKQYNKHNNVYVLNMSLPASLLSQEYHVHFFSTSPHASTAEQFSAIKSQMQETLTRPFPAFNAHTNRPCKFRLFPFGFPADNPQQADECSCAGGQSTCNCRKCHNRRRPPPDNGSGENVQWYIRNYAPASPRSASETLAELQNQLDLARTDGVTAVKKSQTNTGVKDKVTEYWIAQLLQRAKDLKAQNRKMTQSQVADELLKWLNDQPGDKYNVLLDWMGVDPHKDTPVEILHTVLLGIVKYMWHALHTPWSQQNAQLFVTRLQATDTSGLNIPPIRAAYMMQYKNGLIGKHFKTIGQVCAFHVHDLTSKEQFRLVKATGALLPVLWYPIIKDMESYLADLQVLIDNLLAAFALIDPLRILEKIKLHILTHIVDDIRRFGPAVRFSTEIFECFNAIFRMCSVLSNHLAPSRDIALSLADLDRFKHIVSGGYWFDGAEWVRAGEKVREVLLQHRIVQQHLGWAPETVFTAVKLLPDRKRQFRPLTSAEAAILVDSQGSFSVSEMTATSWSPALNVTSRCGDICSSKTWIAFEDRQMQTHIGRLSEILVPANGVGRHPLVIVEQFTVGTSLHPILDMPVLKYDKKVAITPTNVLFDINVQHDCITCKCTDSGTRVVQQERQDSEVCVAAWEHTSAQRFVINLHAIHNALELRELLPRALTQPRPLWEDKDKELLLHSKDALTKYVHKEKERKAKVALTRQRNLAAKQQESGPRGDSGRDDPEGDMDNTVEGDEDENGDEDPEENADDGQIAPQQLEGAGQGASRYPKRKRTHAA